MNNILLAVLVFLSANNALADNVQRSINVHAGAHHADRAKFDRMLDERYGELRFEKRAVPSPKVKKHTEAAKLTYRNDLAKGKRAPKDAVHRVVIAVKQRGLKELEAYVNDISNHKSRNYGKHLSRAQIRERTANPRSSAHIVAKLEEEGFTIVKTSKNKEYITVDGPISKWETMFSTEFHEFNQLHGNGLPLLRAEHYTLPDFMEEHVTAVFNTVQFPDVKELYPRKKVHTQKLSESEKTAVKRSVQGNSFAGYMTPTLLNSYYNITSNWGNGLGSQCLYESLNQSYSPSDLTIFQNTFGLPVEPVAQDIGGHAYNNACLQNGGNDCGEANLDVQYIMAVAQNISTIYYYWGEQDFVLDWVTTMADSDNPPLVDSVSYSSYEYYMSQSYADQFNTEAMKLMAMGVTLLSASGDDGVAGYMARNSPILCGYYPQFPATSPYVVAVGGSMGPENGTPEIACQGQLSGGVITTGGGFSTLYDQPSWQTTFIDAYFANVSNTNRAPYQGYNRQGRGYPDVTLAAASYYTVNAGQETKVWGTSASTPVFAGFVALVNAKRLAAGKSTLGWINPSLYALYDQILENDITSGINNCVANAMVCCIQGFYAAKGWDPLTGLGSINYGKFEEVFFALGDQPNLPYPTTAPTTIDRVPTASPVMAAGWVYDSFYEGEDCTESAATIIGFATNTCFQNFDGSGAVIGSTMYTCGSVTASRMEYSDSLCSVLHKEVTYFLGCALSVDSYYAQEIFSNSLQCVATADGTIPVPLTKPYVIEASYQGLCNTTQNVAFEANVQDFCFNYGSHASGGSYKYVWPYYYAYAGLNCKSQNQYEKDYLSSACAAIPYEPIYDDNYGYMGAEIGTTMEYSTFYEITTSTNYQFTVTQVLVGITSTQFNNNLAPNTNAVIYAVAESINGITEQNVAVTGIASASRRLTASVESVAAFRGLAESNTQVTYTVNYNYVALGYTNNTICYDALMASLQASLADNTFSNALQSYGTANNVADMAGVTSTSATASQPISVNDLSDDDDSSSSDDKSSGLSRMQLGGIIIGVIVFVVIVGGCVWFKYRQSHKPTSSSNVGMEVNSGNPIHK